MTFCKFLDQGLVYNNNVTEFVVSPCCYFSERYSISPDLDVVAQLENFKEQWKSADVTKTCKICMDHEAGGLTSYRQAANNIVIADQGLAVVTIAVNKKCNLACPTCDDSSSSHWYKQNQLNGVEVSDKIINLHREDTTGAITDKFMSLVSSQDLSNLQYIKFGGGEPFMSGTHHEVLKLIPNPENVTVQYTSNFSTTPNKKTLALWEKFKLIKWVASIDGVADRFDFLRWPYQWQDLNKFKSKMWESVPVNVMFGCEHTLNPLNILYYDEFEEWFNQEFSANRLGDASDLNLHYAAGIMGLDHANQELRLLVSKKYGAAHPVSTLLSRVAESPNHAPMIEYLDKLARWRNQDWRKLFPEVAECYR